MASELLLTSVLRNSTGEVSWKVLYTKQAQKDARKINIQHRLVYQILEKENIVKIIRMWTHYE